MLIKYNVLYSAVHFEYAVEKRPLSVSSYRLGFRGGLWFNGGPW
jgi:hypothetical protein